MQQQRRSNPYPWTWEVPVGVGLALLVLLAVGVQVGRGLALLVSGHGWQWPAAASLVSSVPAILGGRSDAGLGVHGDLAPDAVLAVAILAVELVLLAAAGVGFKVGWDRWGTGRLLGMATRDEAEQVLGVRRLIRVRRIVRPDLYGKARA
jgi:hypothetical protein